MLRRLGTLIGYFSDTPRRTRVAVLFSAAVLGLFEFFIHEITAHSGLPMISAAILDAVLLGASGGALVWVLLTGNRDRRQRVRLELERIAEVNHEIRNALQVITHSHFDAEPHHQAMVLQSVQRIDAVLKRVFPVVGGKLPAHNIGRKEG